jgi:hypothetical protein
MMIVWSVVVVAMLLVTGVDRVQGQRSPTSITFEIQQDPVAEAIAIADAAISDQFATNQTVAQLYILGERQGQIAPILQIQVTREQWQQQPQAAVWAKYVGYTFKRREGTTITRPPVRSYKPEGEGEPNFYGEPRF